MVIRKADKMVKTLLIIVLSALVLPTAALAATFQSIGQSKAILYDGPSTAASKHFIVRQFYPVELIVQPLNGWAKVRDAEGGLFFVEEDKLSSLRTLLVRTENVQLHEGAAASSKVLANIEKQVVLLLEAPEPENGWLSVKTIDGTTGFVPLHTVWGY